MLELIQTFPELVKPSEDGSAAASRPSVDGGSRLNASTLSPTNEAYIGNRLSMRSTTPIADQFASPASSVPSPATGVSELPALSSSQDPNAATSSTEDLALTYVPNDAKYAYRRLLEILLSHDLAKMADLDPTEEVSLRILSTHNQDLLRECGTWWRIMASYECWAFLDDMTKRFRDGEMPVVECIVEALSDFDKVDSKWPNEAWPTQVVSPCPRRDAWCAR